MPYRKVSYWEQAWYLIRYALRHGFGRKEKHDRT